MDKKDIFASFKELEAQMTQHFQDRKEQEHRFDKLNEDFHTAIRQIAELIEPQLTGKPFKSKESYKYQPVRVSSIEAGSHLISKKQILLLTGAGVSAASGIPTFRGCDGFWKRLSYAGVQDPMVILTTTFFKQNPGAVWNWHYDFHELQKKCKPNDSHKSILRFQEHCVINKLPCMLITQNIDDYHCELVRNSSLLNTDSQIPFTPHVFEIHGNVFYMHCSDEQAEHSRNFKRCPNFQSIPNRQFVPSCEECGKPMKPHSMFFDEQYSEHYYRSTTVQKFVADADCLIVVGTTLATNLALKIVNQFLDSEKLIIEVNIESCIPVGNTLQVLEKSEIALPKLFENFIRL